MSRREISGGVCGGCGTGFGHYHQQFVAHVGREFDATQLYAATPAGDVVGQKGEKHVAELFSLFGRVAVGGASAKTVQLLVVVIFYLVADG